MPTNYQLNASETDHRGDSVIGSVRRFVPFLKGEEPALYLTLVAMLFSSLTALAAPVVIGHVIDTGIATHDYRQVLTFSGVLLVIFLVGSYASYVQNKSMGGVGRRVLFGLRNTIFAKLQELPVAFFNQNRAGDLISRINNDTDKLNQFF
jgi:ATP-binding cassette subfamily B protein